MRFGRQLPLSVSVRSTMIKGSWVWHLLCPVRWCIRANRWEKRSLAILAWGRATVAIPCGGNLVFPAHSWWMWTRRCRLVAASRCRLIPQQCWCRASSHGRGSSEEVCELQPQAGIILGLNYPRPVINFLRPQEHCSKVCHCPVMECWQTDMKLTRIDLNSTNFCCPDTGIQFWANSSAASTVSILGNAAILLGGLYLLSRSDEVWIFTLMSQTTYFCLRWSPSKTSSSPLWAPPARPQRHHLHRWRLGCSRGWRACRGFRSSCEVFPSNKGSRICRSCPGCREFKEPLVEWRWDFFFSTLCHSLPQDLTEQQMQKMQVIVGLKSNFSLKSCRHWQSNRLKRFR